MPDRVLVRFANISAAPLDLAVSPDMTVGQLKEIVWGGWPEAKTKEAESEVPYAKLRITGHGRGEFLRDSQVLGDTSVYVTKGSVALTTPDGSAVHLMALYRSIQLACVSLHVLGAWMVAQPPRVVGNERA
ncbi:hypothetical protein FNF31_00220 [Cafeteria roenbergensis]|uniref:UBL3-like ubiquitin domain-containing protein n=1 Tax=Cafeteria roenbergensis TaxID=33653 RepID=A0A5A8DZ31_CAFRO|nr:hypothetical protein FNF31_00220 [Cafeteria roenbergensis]